MGGLAQYLNDMSVGTMSLVVNLNDDPSADFQEGREAGRFWSSIQGRLETVVGAYAVLKSATLIPPTAAATAATSESAVTVPIGGATLAIEVATLAGGAAETWHGYNVVQYNSKNPVSNKPSGSGSSTGKWGQGSFDSPEESLQYHFEEHGADVGAQSIQQYLRKAEAFAANLRGATKYPVEGATEGVIRYVKNGRYIDIAPDKTIISFGIAGDR
jgi:hypothetical protein